MSAIRQAPSFSADAFGDCLIRSVLEAIGDASCVKSATGKYLLCNAAFADLVDHRPEEVQGKLDWELFPPDVALLLQDRHRAAIATGSRETCEFDLQRPTGTRRYLQTIVPLLDPGGAKAGSVGVTRDVTVSHQAKESLDRKERQVTEAQMLARLGSWEWDVVSDRVTWSDAMHHMMGTAPDIEQPSYTSYLNRVHPADRRRISDILNHALKTGEPFEFEHRLMRTDGAELTVLCRGLVMRDDEEIPTRIFGTNQDITRHRDAERSLREAIAQADRANAAKSEFLSKMSHELRTPLNAILGFGQVMQSDPEVRDPEAVEQILAAGRHLLSLIDEILDLATIEAGKAELSPGRIALHDVVRECIDLIRPVAEQHSIHLRVAPAMQEERYVWGDGKRVKQVVLNLLSNGVKYNRPGGSVALDCRGSTLGVVRVEVSDTGPGLTPDQISGLFQPFNRVGAERTGTEGTGLGLALSKGFVEAMGGRMGVESGHGRGSTFWMELPTIERPPSTPGVPPKGEHATADPSAAPGAPDSTSHSVRRRILYIEDSPANLRLLERMASRRGDLEMVCADTAATGLIAAREHRPDLILLDVQLPDMNGDEVLWRLQQDPELRDVPVVAISGDATQRQIRRLLDLGAREYHTKPLDLPRLLKAIDSALESRSPAKPEAA